MPWALETNVARYWPFRSPVHCMGTSVTSPPGPVTLATTCASLISTNVSSTTSAVMRDRFPGLDTIGRRVHFDRPGHAVDEPAEELTPEVLVRHVLERNTRVHLPAPRIEHRERQRLAAPVALERQHRLRAALLVGSGQEHRRARLDGLDRIDADERRQLVPAVERRGFGRRNLRQRVAFAGARRPHLQPRHRPGVERARHALDDHRQRIGNRRPGIAALGERSRAAEHQQAAAAALDELRHHAQLIAGERAGLDAAENQAAVREQLVARLGKPAGELLGRVDQQPVELVVRRPQERDDLQVLVVVARRGEGT